MSIRINVLILATVILSTLISCATISSTNSSATNNISLNLSTPRIYDKFNNGDGLLNAKTAASGQTWQLTGAGYNSARIINGMFVSHENVYAYLPFGGTVSWLGGSFSFIPGLGANDPTVQGMTLIADQTFGGLSTMLHLNFGPKSWSLMKRISGGAFIPMLSGQYNLRTDGTVYTISMAISEDTVFVIAPDGKVSYVTDPDVSAITARYGCWQITGYANMFIGRWNSVEGDFK